ncbi:MAG: hypothetical protein MK066_01540 [Crocinitomicaceae bacterium]|nr:hypothetical protein [Crocinitomicaceae bacterium]
MKSLLFIISIYLTFSAFSQDYPNLVSNQEITTIAYWNLGDKVRYHCVQEQQNFKNGKDKPYITDKKEFDLTLEVMDSSSTSYTIQLKYSNFILPESTNNDFVQSILTEFSILYTTDEFGAFDSIVNKTELKERVQTTIDLNYNDLDSLTISRLKTLFSKENNIENLFIEDIYSIHNLYGIGLTLNEPITYDLDYPTLEDISVLGQGTITVKTINATRNYASIYMTQRPNKVDLKKYIKDLGRVLFPEHLDDLSNFSVSSKMNQFYDMTLSNGWMTKIKSKKTTTVKVKKKMNKQVNSYSYILQ